MNPLMRHILKACGVAFIATMQGLFFASVFTACLLLVNHCVEQVRNAW